MKKLYDIPIYAISPSTLGDRVNEYIVKLRKVLIRSDAESIARVVDIETFPRRNWDYNHIIGYIRIAVTKTDILFDVFLPIPIPKRYDWKTTKKVYVQNIGANGTHIYLDRMKTNKEICEAITQMLDQIIIDHIPRRFYIDREAFDTINEHLNYLSIIEEKE